MKTIESKIDNLDITSVSPITDVTSKSSFHPTSKTDFNPISIAAQADGANDIVALAGAFAECKVRDWKNAKTNYLTEHL